MLSPMEQATPTLLHSYNSSRRTIPKQEAEAGPANSSAKSAEAEVEEEGEGDSIASAITVTMDVAVAINAVAADNVAEGGSRAGHASIKSRAHHLPQSFPMARRWAGSIRSAKAASSAEPRTATSPSRAMRTCRHRSCVSTCCAAVTKFSPRQDTITEIASSSSM